jgi:hypothetical protein
VHWVIEQTLHVLADHPGDGAWRDQSHLGYWRKDYEVPVYSVNIQFVRAKVTCRMNGDGWFLEYSQAVRGEQLKKLLR